MEIGRELDDETIERLVLLSQEAAGKAYAPYSKYNVGAAILTAAGNIFTGANVENRSYPLSMCAERAAVYRAIAENGSSLELLAIAVSAGKGGPCAPCGGCRQVLAEFGGEEMLVVYEGTAGRKRIPLRTMLPDGSDFY